MSPSRARSSCWLFPIPFPQRKYTATRGETGGAPAAGGGRADSRSWVQAAGVQARVFPNDDSVQPSGGSLTVTHRDESNLFDIVRLNGKGSTTSPLADEDEEAGTSSGQHNVEAQHPVTFDQGNLKIVEKDIGSGAFATVDRCEIPRLGICAVKFMIKEAGWKTNKETQLGLDAEMLANVRMSGTPFIVPMLGHSTEMNESTGRSVTTAIAFQEMEGGNMDTAIMVQVKDQGGRWWIPPEDLIRKYALPTASALMEMHKKGLLHCDVKPGNLLLDKDGMAHVCDLGLAVKFRSSKRLTTKTIGGTWGYMAPELQFWNGRGAFYPVTDKADVYSFGVTMFEIMTCLSHTPPRDKGEESYVPAVPRSLLVGFSREQVPQPWVNLLEACLKWDPKRRPSMKQVHNTMQAMLV
mmetsp:Transcript_32750/g.92900  ORF Transcript_32750/g.92900 Transcript_32750/m.92900 type:complete len:409 (-) Transcript_32750:413-1639(-)|eukprot:CAMPEP_0117654348 /NCGR_PEP_ID=MMETSP0804-20121206/3696_1 /TAXON_ID=1074897 /ORGANISM="Tetraselmis astigmatica, Strain CCMP880" /LENGTH=408 /DNA_ID=CAMNT_0005460623 /DNA_START=146 /DNA_END=1372 /DNA_ORIENTATION=-